MRVQKINFINYKMFKNHEVIFGTDNQPTISFLVGNNGAGKTIVLESIYNLFTNPFNTPEDFEVEYTILLTEDEKTELSITDNSFICHLKKNGNNNSRTCKKITGEALGDINISQASKIVYSTIEVVFSEQNFTTITAKNTDDTLKPKEKSQNLSTEIPQLLIDIKNIDDSENSEWLQNNLEKPGKDKPATIGIRLKRFTEAFHKIYNGSKKFKEIKNENNSKKIIFLDLESNEISLNQLSTGEKQVIYRVGYLLKNLNNLKGGIVLIDEPEISMHPVWQTALKNFIKEVFTGFDIQIIISTHSPYIFKQLNNEDEVVIKLDKTKSNSTKIDLNFKNKNFIPSVNLISYIAYGITSDSLHTELYTWLQIQENKEIISETEAWLKSTTGGDVINFKTFLRTKAYKREVVGASVRETLPTFIRNKINHGDEIGRSYSEIELEDSIKILLSLLKV